jgi:hypothetical protein
MKSYSDGDEISDISPPNLLYMTMSIENPFPLAYLTIVTVYATVGVDLYARDDGTPWTRPRRAYVT